MIDIRISGRGRTVPGVTDVVSPQPEIGAVTDALNPLFKTPPTRLVGKLLMGILAPTFPFASVIAETNGVPLPIRVIVVLGSGAPGPTKVGEQVRVPLTTMVFMLTPKGNGGSSWPALGLVRKMRNIARNKRIVVDDDDDAIVVWVIGFEWYDDLGFGF